MLITVQPKELQLQLERELESLEIISCHEHHLIPKDGELVTLDYIFQNSYVGWCGKKLGRSVEERDLHKKGRHQFILSVASI